MARPEAEIERVLGSLHVSFEPSIRERARSIRSTPINVVTAPEPGKWRRRSPRDRIGTVAHRTDDEGPGVRHLMRSTEIDLDTSSRSFVDLSGELARFIQPGEDGLLNVFVPHATAGLAIMETGSGSRRTSRTALSKLLPRDYDWRHSHGSPGHGADHVLPAFICAVGHGSSDRRKDPIGDMAERGVRRSQPLQPATEGAALAPKVTGAGPSACRSPWR